MTLAKPLVSVIIVNWNGNRVLNRCLTALSNQTFKDFEIILVDNGSTDGSVDKIGIDGFGIKIERLPTNQGFAAANNLGVSLAKGRWIALLNTDAFPAPTWLEYLIMATQENPEFTFFASCLIMANRPGYLDGTGDVYHCSGQAWRRGYGKPSRGVWQERDEVFGPCAAAALYLRESFLQVGGFDEDFFCYLEDVDLAFRLRLIGQRCLYIPEAVVEHVGSESHGRQSDFNLYYGYRNMVWTFFKNMPSPLIWKYLPFHLSINLIHLAWFSWRGQGRTIWKAKRDAFRGLQSILKKRRKVQKECRVKSNEISCILNLNFLGFMNK
jgi:GT2 family glycosyltransferase